VRIARVVLQVLLGCLYLSVLAAFLRSRFDLVPFLGVSAFFAFMFLLTLLLREHTEARLVAGRTVSPRVVGAFLAFVGLGIFLMACGMVFGDVSFSEGRRRWLAFVVDLVGPWPPAIVFFLVGLQLLYTGYRAWRGA
jgi:hypothetical protein